MPKDVFVLVLLGFQPSLVLMNSSSYKLLIITLVCLDFILISEFLRHYFMYAALSILLLGQKALKDHVSYKVHIQTETVSSRISHVWVAHCHAVFSSDRIGYTSSEYLSEKLPI